MFKKRSIAASLLGAISVAALLAACLLGPTPTAHAGLIDVRVDFGDAVAAPTNWNMMHRSFMSTVTATGSEQALNDFNDFSTPTGVSLKVTKAFYPSGATDTSGSFAWESRYAPWLDAGALPALRDWTMAYSTSTPGQFVVTGLNPNELYNVELLGVRGSTSGAEAKYLVNGSPGQVLFGSAHQASVTPGTTANWSAREDGYHAAGSMEWREFAPNGDGTIVIDVDRQTGTYAFLNAMRLTTAPKPTTITHGETSAQMHFVPVGNPGNAADTHADVNRNGYGAVPYRYKMGTYEVSVDQWDVVADPAAGDISIGVGSPRFSGDQPITEVSWYAAAQYCNWLTSGDKEKGVYTFQYNQAGTEITGVTTNRPLATYRHGKVYALPNENEWYKAAYYDPGKDGTGGYWNYGTQQDSAPTPLPDGGGMTGAVYDRYASGTYPTLDYPESVLLAGGASHYDTVGQSGNAFEWVEDYHTGTSGDRVRRGGSYANHLGFQAATFRGSRPPDSVAAPYNLGFRVTELSLLRDVRIDFGSAYKVGGVPVSPEGWNLVATPDTSIPLQDFNDFTGDPVASISFARLAVSGLVDPDSTWSNSEAPWMDDNGRIALKDYIVSYGTSTYDPGQITLSGLDPEALYNIELLSARAYTTSATFLVNGVEGEAVFPPDTAYTGSTLAWDTYADGHTNKGFMRWLSVAPDGNGTIVIDAHKGTGGYAFLMGMRISLVPEPGAVLLLIAGLPVLLARRRKRRV